MQCNNTNRDVNSIFFITEFVPNNLFVIFIVFLKGFHQENVILGFRSNINKLIKQNPFVPHMFRKVCKGNSVEPIF